jgi:putative membrane protein
MSKIARWLVGLVAALNVVFMSAEMFFWKSFSVLVAKLPQPVADATVPLGINQGLYNGFLAAGLIWSLFVPAPFDRKIAIFFLACVFVAGLVGGVTINPPNYGILATQLLSAIVALVALLKTTRTSTS